MICELWNFSSASEMLFIVTNTQTFTAFAYIHDIVFFSLC